MFTKKLIEEDIIKVETYFPLKNPHGFTNAEINCLFDVIPTLVSYRPYTMTRKGGTFTDKVGFGTEEYVFINDKNSYLQYYKETIAAKNQNKIKYLKPNYKIKANLGFTTFLDQTYIHYFI